MNKINLLGINVSTLSKQQVLKKIEQFLSHGKQHQVATPNPELILEAHSDEEFFYILNKADLAVPDGIGLKFAAWLIGKNIYRFAGADLVKEILESSKLKVKSLKVAVINWKRGLSQKEDIEKVLAKYPYLQFMVEDFDREISTAAQDFASLRDFNPDIVFCTFGAPYQEKFIYHTLPKLPSVKIGIGVGGAFDFLTGKTKRAPKIMRIAGLEWLWRLIKHPWRLRRIYNAVVVFPYKFFKWRFVLPFLYRPNVACLLYKKENKKYYILVVERAEQPGHWQLPQGGTDGLKIERAGIKELKEEINCNKFKVIKIFRNLYKYTFGCRKEENLARAENCRKHTGYKGQKQNLLIAEFLGRDSDIKINFWDHVSWKWVNSENLANEVHPTRQEAAKIFLDKFNTLKSTNFFKSTNIN